MKKVLADTNVLISALLFGGQPRQVLNLAIEKKIFLISSPVLLIELMGVLGRKFGWEDKKLQILEKRLRKLVILIEPKQTVDIIKDDPADNRVLECAQAGRVDFIVSGDKHLLTISKFKGVSILSPAEFLKNL